MQRVVLSVLTIVVLATGCVESRKELVSCEQMPIKNWAGLLKLPPFSTMEYRQETPLEPISQTSQMRLGDSNYEYGVLLTYDFLYPPGPKNQFEPENRCVKSASLLVRYPLKDSGVNALSVFTKLLGNGHLSLDILSKINEAQIKEANLQVLGRIKDAEVLAGLVEHGGRGMFFLVEIRPIFVTVASD